MTFLDQLLDEFWGLVHEPITSPKRMKLVLGTIALRLAQEGHLDASAWLLDHMEGEAPLNRRQAARERRERTLTWLPHDNRRSIVRREFDAPD